jgi:hypothetical protein
MKLNFVRQIRTIPVGQFGGLSPLHCTLTSYLLTSASIAVPQLVYSALVPSLCRPSIADQ